MIKISSRSKDKNCNLRNKRYDVRNYISVQEVTYGKNECNIGELLLRQTLFGPVRRMYDRRKDHAAHRHVHSHGQLVARSNYKFLPIDFSGKPTT